MLNLRPLDSAASTFLRGRKRSQRALVRLRPGAVLAVAVISVVGVVGLIQWNQRLIVTGFVAGTMIIAINIVVVTTRHWHRRNTRLEATYASAEEVVRRRTPRQR